MSAEKLKVVICDDEEPRRNDWKTAIESQLDAHCVHEVTLLSGGKGGFNEQYQQLLSRRSEARERRAKGERRVPFDRLPDDHEYEPNDFDSADVLLVDYDLYRFKKDEYLTGSVVAYLARCYSDAKLIVGVNEHGENPFDLTLADTPESFSDVIIGEKQLGNPLLWFGQEKGMQAFRPWYWPPLLDLVTRLPKLTATVAVRLDEHVLDITGLGKVQKRVPRSALGYLERSHSRDEMTSLYDLAAGPRLGLHRGDEAMSKRALATIAAARTHKWLARVVLPLQDVLIDAPHLVSRNGALLNGGEHDDTARAPAAHNQLPLVEQLAEHAHQAPDWLSIPTYYWPLLSTQRDLPGVANPYDIPETELVFGEDISSFLPQQQARRFVSRLVDSSAPARWVADPRTSKIKGLEDVEYQPGSRLAL